MNAMTEQARTVHRLSDLIHNIRVAMLTTVAPSGALHGRPMIAQQDLRDDVLWFFVRQGDPKVEEVRRNPHVSVSFAAPAASRYVSASGKAELVQGDRAKMAELWSSSLEPWFPRGLEDPDLALLRVDIEHAEFWDESTGAMAYVGGLLKSFLTGEAEAPAGHKRVDFAGA